MHGTADDDSEHSGLVEFSIEKAIDTALTRDEDGFVPMLVDFAHRYSAKVRQDHQTFVDLFRNGQIRG